MTTTARVFRSARVLAFQFSLNTPMTRRHWYILPTWRCTRRRSAAAGSYYSCRTPPRICQRNCLSFADTSVQKTTQILTLVVPELVIPFAVAADQVGDARTCLGLTLAQAIYGQAIAGLRTKFLLILSGKSQCAFARFQSEEYGCSGHKASVNALDPRPCFSF